MLYTLRTPYIEEFTVPSKKAEEPKKTCDNCDAIATYTSDGKVASVVHLCANHAKGL